MKKIHALIVAIAITFITGCDSDSSPAPVAKTTPVATPVASTTPSVATQVTPVATVKKVTNSPATICFVEPDKIVVDKEFTLVVIVADPEGVKDIQWTGPDLSSKGTEVKHTLKSEKEFAFTVTVTDNKNVQTTVQSIVKATKEAVVVENTPPKVCKMFDRTVEVNEEYSLNFCVSDKEGNVEKYEIFVDGNSVASVPVADQTNGPNTNYNFTHAMSHDEVSDKRGYKIEVVAYDAHEKHNKSLSYTRVIEAEPEVDTIKPVITITGGTTAMTVGGTYTPPTVTAMDNVDGDITSSIVKSGDTVNPAVAGTYTELYDVMDESGNKAIQGTYTVVVSLEADTEAPALTMTEHTVTDTGTLGVEIVDYAEYVSDNVTSDANLGIEVTTPNVEVAVTNTGASVRFERIAGGAGDEVIGFVFVDEAGNKSAKLTQTIGGLDTI